MSLKSHISQRDLVSIHRERVDALRIQGIVIAASKELLLLRYVYDFRPDGLLVLSRDSVSKLQVTATDEFQRQMLVDEGIFDRIDFEPQYPVDSWRSFLTAVKEENRLLILEEEFLPEPSFVIGTVSKVGKKKASCNYFTGIARWEKEPVKVSLKQLTSCQINNGYLSAYERYFARNA